MTRYAILISVEEYSHFLPTKFTHADNDLIYETLTRKCDYAEQHTKAIKLGPSAIKTPLEVLSEISAAVSNSTHGDSILFYFAGHGHYHEGKTYIILPNTVPGAYETTALSFDDISNELRVNERSCFRLFDACHSGLDVRDGEGQLNSSDFIRSINHDASGWVTLAACKEDQYSICDPKIGHGIFTYYLCNEITEAETNEQIYPEILKVRISDKVVEHSKSLGYIQTPTLNASISGNISIATRRADIAPTSNEKLITELETQSLEFRIAKLKEIKDVLTSEYLESILGVVSEECFSAFKERNQLNFDMLQGPKISANDIPNNMHSNIVKFANNIGIQSRHNLKRYEEEYEDPYSQYLGIMSTLYARKKKTTVNYYVSQPSDMPNSASIIELKGDGRSLPNIKILIYIIPLQITGCMLVSIFNSGWQSGNNEVSHIKNYYQMLKPEDSIERIKEIGPFAAEDAMEKITDIVQKRVELLERELKG